MVGVVFDMLDDSKVGLGVGACASGRVVEVVGRAGECVDFQLGEFGGREVVEEPVQDGTAFDAALAVHDQNHFLVLVVEQGFLDLGVACSDVGRGVIGVSLDEAFQSVKNDAIGNVVDADYRTAEDAGEGVEVGLKPVPSYRDSIDEDPALVVVAGVGGQVCGGGLGRAVAVEEFAEVEIKD